MKRLLKSAHLLFVALVAMTSQVTYAETTPLAASQVEAISTLTSEVDVQALVPNTDAGFEARCNYSDYFSEGSFDQSERISARRQLEDILATLYEEQGIYFRSYIFAAFGGLPAGNIIAIATRLAGNAAQIGNVYGIYYGPQIATTVTQLLNQFLIFGETYVQAVVAGDLVTAQIAFNNWVNQGNVIADFLSGINPFLNNQIARTLFAQYIQLEVAQTIAVANGDFSGAITLFDQSRIFLRNFGAFFADAIIDQIIGNDSSSSSSDCHRRCSPCNGGLFGRNGRNR